MPCNSDYLEPDVREVRSRELSELISYVIGTGEFEGWYDTAKISVYISVYREPYGNVSLLDEMTAFLCGVLGNMNDQQKARILYDGRNKMARRLADWWDEHQEADKLREEELEDTKEMEFLSQYIDLDKNSAPIIRGFLEGFLEVMDSDEPFMSYREGMDTVIKLCKKKEKVEE